MCFFFLMIRRPPRSTRTDTLFPYTTLFRSLSATALANLNDSALDAILLDAENILFFTRRNQRRLGHDQRLFVGELQPYQREHAWTQRAIGIGHIGPQTNRTPADVAKRTEGRSEKRRLGKECDSQSHSRGAT